MEVSYAPAAVVSERPNLLIDKRPNGSQNRSEFFGQDKKSLAFTGTRNPDRPKGSKTPSVKFALLLS